MIKKCELTRKFVPSMDRNRHGILAIFTFSLKPSDYDSLQDQSRRFHKLHEEVEERIITTVISLFLLCCSFLFFFFSISNLSFSSCTKRQEQYGALRCQKMSSLSEFLKAKEM